MRNKNTAKTVHGDIEYETVKCSSCGNEVLKKNAKPVYISHGEVSEYGALDRVSFYDGYSKGWACEYCRDEQLVGFPTQIKHETALLMGMAVMIGILIGLMIGVIA